MYGHGNAIAVLPTKSEPTEKMVLNVVQEPEDEHPLITKVKEMYPTDDSLQGMKTPVEVKSWLRNVRFAQLCREWTNTATKSTALREIDTIKTLAESLDKVA